MTTDKDTEALIEWLRWNYENWALGSKGPPILLDAAATLRAQQARIKELEAERDQARAMFEDCVSQRAEEMKRAETAEARVKELEALNARIQASDEWYYRGRPVVEWVKEVDGFESALEVIAGSHWERTGYCQSDVEDVPDLTGIEAQSHARATLQRFRAARAFMQKMEGGTDANNG